MDHISEDGINVSDVSTMNVENLKESLRKRNLSRKGKKDELRTRLLESIRMDNDEPKNYVDHTIPCKSCVNITDFNNFLSDFTDFKQHVTMRLSSLQDDKESEEITEMKRELRFLREELQNKKEIIKILQTDNEALRYNTQTPERAHQKQSEEFTYKSTINQTSHPTMNQQIRNNLPSTSNVQLSNRFEGLENQPSHNIWSINDENVFARKKHNSKAKQKHVNNRFIVQNPEQNTQQVRKSLSGNVTVPYNKRNKKFKNILIIGDSIIRHIDYRQLNNQLHCGKAFIKFFPGANVKQIEHYIIPHLIERSPDAVVIHAGTNDIRPRDPKQQIKSSMEIANNIINIAKACLEHGVTDVFISGITCRSVESDMKKILDTNCHLMNFCDGEQLHFISNNNIQKENLWDDGLHLNDSGLSILTNNFFTSLNRILI